MAVLDHDHHWPSLPPIRTTSASRVSCETLSLPCSPPSRRSRPPSSPSPFSAHGFGRCSRHHRSDIASTPSKHPPFQSADASPCSASAPSTATSSTSQFFSHCFPHRVFHTTPSNCFSPASRTPKGGKKSAARMLRSIIGFSPAAMNQFSPSNLQFSGTMSPSASRMHAAAAATPGTTPNYSGPLLRGSKGHSANLFTMIPVEMVGKKKPPDGYQAEEPTSPEVTCMGRVRKKKAALLIKDNLSGRGKRGKVKKLGSDSPLRTEFNRQSSVRELDASSKMVRQRSGRRTYDFHGYDDALCQGSEPALSDVLHKPLESLHLDVLPTSCANVEDAQMAPELSSTKDTPVLGALHSDSVGVADLEKPEKQSIVLDWDVRNLIAVSDDRKAGDLQRSDVPSIGKSDPACPSSPHDRSLDDANSTVREAKADTAGDVIAEACPSEVPPPNCLLLMRNRSSSRSTSRSFP